MLQAGLARSAPASYWPRGALQSRLGRRVPCRVSSVYRSSIIGSGKDPFRVRASHVLCLVLQYLCIPLVHWPIGPRAILRSFRLSLALRCVYSPTRPTARHHRGILSGVVGRARRFARGMGLWYRAGAGGLHPGGAGLRDGACHEPFFSISSYMSGQAFSRAIVVDGLDRPTGRSLTFFSSRSCECSHPPTGRSGAMPVELVGETLAARSWKHGTV